MAEPLLKAFLFCHSSSVGQDGTRDVRGVWQQLGAHRLPARYPVTLFVCWANLERTRYLMEMQVRVPEAPEPFLVQVPVETSGNPRLDWMNLVHLDLVIVREGDIHFDISLDGRPYGSCCLPVLLQERSGS